MKRKYIILIIVIVILGLIFFRLSSNKKVLDAKAAPVKDTLIHIPVKIAVAAKELQTVQLIKTGSLAPFKEAKVLAITAGTLQSLQISLGDQVHEGQVLATVDSRSARLDLDKANSNLSKLKNDLQTYTELYEGQAATKEKLNQVKQDYLDAENQVAQIKRQLSDAAIKAPTSGIISEKPVEQGVFVSAGTQIATIVNLSQIKVQVYLTEAEVYQVKQGQQVKITTEQLPDEVFTGKVSFISPQADATHNYLVEITGVNHKDAPLRSGSFVYADFSTKKSDSLLFIPREAINRSIQDASVYVVNNNIVHLQKVQTGIEQNGKIQILSGLQVADTVVTSGQINLTDGSSVSVSK